MKIAAINGSLSEISYNRKLLQFIQHEFSHELDIDILELHDVPVFQQFVDQTDHVAIQHIYRTIHNADGVIIATGEHSHTVLPAVKNIIEHLSVDLHPFNNKPVLVVGASYYNQGSSRAQLHLKQILEAPGVNAYTMPGNEFLLSNAREAFDDHGRIKDEDTVQFLREVLGKFKAYVSLITAMEGKAKPIYPEEDLSASKPIETTIEGIPYDADDWVEQAAEKVKAAEGSDYVKLKRGVLTVDQINYLLASLPMDISFVDENNQFLYYKNSEEKSEDSSRPWPEDVGSSMKDVHLEKSLDRVQKVIQALRYGEEDCIEIPTFSQADEKHVVQFYQAMRDENGHYRGVNQYSLDLKEMLDLYLKQSDQELTATPPTQAIWEDSSTDATSGASSDQSADDACRESTDATSGASE